MNRKRAENIFTAMTDIDERYLEEAENFKGGMVTVHPGRKRRVAIAACFVLIMAVAFPALNNLFSKSMKASMPESNFAADSAVQSVDENAGAEKKSANAADGAMSRLSSSAPSDVKITSTVSDDAELTFEIKDYDFDNEQPYITVVWTNNTDREVDLTPRFGFMEVNEDGTFKEAVMADSKITFPAILYPLQAGGGTREETYFVGACDYYHTGKYVMFLDDTKESPYRIDLDLTFDNE